MTADTDPGARTEGCERLRLYRTVDGVVAVHQSLGRTDDDVVPRQPQGVDP
ncbi:hypothetical protein [Streptomyces brasiliensis]|uniref:hypothetical protein n=1 Tax=Streptomyces brasiliensis TaxID=1954 RepID=UPI00166F683A|nr:hypothetical protein [Streptomyces brasiliensis]